MRVVARFSAVACLLSLLFILPVNAQKVSGSVSGTVTDESNASVAGASVTIISEQTGASRATTTSAEGTFSFQELNAGMYRLVVSKSGASKNVLRMVPPMCLTLGDVEAVADALDRCFAGY